MVSFKGTFFPLMRISFSFKKSYWQLLLPIHGCWAPLGIMEAVRLNFHLKSRGVELTTFSKYNRLILFIKLLTVNSFRSFRRHSSLEKP